MPSIESLVLPDAKEPWKKVVLEGEVESDFIYASVTGKYLLPFKSHLPPIVLPVKKLNGKIRLFSSQELRDEGKLKMPTGLTLLSQHGKRTPPKLL